VEFFAKGRGTEVVLTHEALPDDGAVASHTAGWASILDLLAARVEARAVFIEPFGPADWPAIRSIYEEGIATGTATFETEVPAWEKWDAAHLSIPRLKAAVSGETAGWAALSPVSSRRVYAGVAEVSVYVGEAYRGCGIGARLLTALVHASEDEGLWSLQAGIFPANTPSLKLHTACGFRVVGTRERLGQLRGVWRDAVLMERRSPRIG
jgi:phosphinothricin acetyltransferase